MLLSIVVCTYNRCQLLEGCLDSLMRQTYAGDNFEVIVVDNNSTDDTDKVVKKICENHTRVRGITEKSQGLSFARNRGWMEALGEFVAYIDDDSRAHVDYVEQVVEFLQKNASVKVLSGPYFCFCNEKIPAWFPEGYGTYSLGEETRPLRDNEWVNGTNMIFQKELLLDIGGFDTGLGMKGDTIAYGEETKLASILRQRGIDMYYVPKIKVDHLIAPYKLSLLFLLKSHYSHGVDSAKIFNRPMQFFRSLAEVVAAVVKFFYVFATAKDKYIKSRLYKSLSPFFYASGELISAMRWMR